MGILLGYVENLFFPNLLIPGVKVGISNIVVLYLLLVLGVKEALIVGVIKAFVNGFAFSGLLSVAYSISGIILSVLVMVFLTKLKFKNTISAIGISVSGSVFFNFGQLITACVLLKSIIPMYYISTYTIISVISGVVTGIVVELIIKSGKGCFYFEKKK